MNESGADFFAGLGAGDLDLFAMKRGITAEGETGFVFALQRDEKLAIFGLKSLHDLGMNDDDEAG